MTGTRPRAGIMNLGFGYALHRAMPLMLTLKKRNGRPNQ
jgi:hypothetical protein